MQVTETLNEGLKRGYAITIPAAELDEKVNAKLAEARPEIQMKGFRKGKAPMGLLKRQFGPRLLGEAMQEAVDGAMNRHFEDSGDRPALRPKVEIRNGEGWKEGNDVEIEMSYEALPDIPEIDMKSIRLERLIVRADDAETDTALEELAESAGTFMDRDEGAAAEDGDQVVIDFVGKVDGEPFDGGSAEDYPLVLGSDAFIPGFEAQLVGVRAGEARIVTATIPTHPNFGAVAGKDASFDCTVKAVQAPVAAEIDDELAKRFGADDVAALRMKIVERLEAGYAQSAREVLKRGLLDALDERVSFDLPPTLVKQEAGQIAHQLWHDEHPEPEDGDGGHDHDHGHEKITPTEEHTRLAERRVRLGLLLAELGQKAEIEVTEQEMNRAIMERARRYPGHEREFLEFIRKNKEIQGQIHAPLFEDKVVDYMFELAEISDREASKDDLQAAVDALEEE